MWRRRMACCQDSMLHSCNSMLEKKKERKRGLPRKQIASCLCLLTLCVHFTHLSVFLCLSLTLFVSEYIMPEYMMQERKRHTCVHTWTPQTCTHSHSLAYALTYLKILVIQVDRTITWSYDRRVYKYDNGSVFFQYLACIYEFSVYKVRWYTFTLLDFVQSLLPFPSVVLTLSTCMSCVCSEQLTWTQYPEKPEPVLSLTSVPVINLMLFVACSLWQPCCSVLWCFLCLCAARDYEIQRDHIKLVEILGEGQFGDVYKGMFFDRVSDSCCCWCLVSGAYVQLLLFLFFSFLITRFLPPPPPPQPKKED